MAKLTDIELRRYDRHLLLEEVGIAGQQRLKDASVLVVGLGGLGSPAAMYLAAAGVGRIGLVDFDVVDASNLQRQVIYGQGDVGERKVESARRRLRELNPFVDVVPHDTRIGPDDALEIMKDYDVIADGTDNFGTRYLINDACVKLKKPNVYASLFRFEGQVSLFDATRGPCYRCLHRDAPPPGAVPSCGESGVLGVLAGVVGSLQANEAVKHIVGIGAPLVGRLLLFDALAMRFRELRVPKDPACPACGASPSVTTLGDPSIISVRALRARLASTRLIDVRGPTEWEAGHLDGATLIPLTELEERMRELDRAADIVVYCQSGTRSRRAVEQLRAAGFVNAKSLDGGIEAWRADQKWKYGCSMTDAFL